ncbi:DMT family transporter [Roseovarius sp. MMSF_3281]|uniref:DMT family transporter n=1 Tax=Roseovarius sp. MMSF_3281 TaxID=3046694 RepID=UPI00273ED132|nr:DMT family transporter [Roseovarius sp. MMSF_3281]
MNKSTLGLMWAFSFVILEAAQAVFFGGVFQNYDSFLIGAAVFGVTAAGTLIWANLKTPGQLEVARSNLMSLLGLNLSTAFVWIAYFFALQMIEPAVVFTIFSGLIPVTIHVAALFGVPEATSVRNRVEGLGLIVVVVAIIYLSAITMLGQSGFVRGDLSVAISGLVLSAVSAVSLAVMMIYSHRLDRLGVAPLAQYGLRFPFYVAVSLVAAWFGLDEKGPVDFEGLAVVIVIGFAIMAFPVFAMQKAISLMSTLTLAAITALGPVFVFLLQMAENRVDYAPATMTGLLIYFAGATLAAYAGARYSGRTAAEV